MIYLSEESNYLENETPNSLKQYLDCNSVQFLDASALKTFGLASELTSVEFIY